MSVVYTPAPLPAAPPPPRPGPLSMLFRLVLGVFALAVPLFGLWLATSLFAHAGLPVLVALVFGGVIVLGLPIAWDFWAEARWRRKQPPPARILSRADRIRLRIFTAGFVFSAGALLVASSASITALAQRGDWFLAGAEGGFATGVRSAIRGIANGLGSALGVTDRAPVPVVPADPVVATAPRPDFQPTAQPTPTRPVPSPTPAPAPTPPSAGKIVWPFPTEPHPAILRMTDSQATDLDAVAAYIKARETDQVQRVKAIHDFVVRHLSYDTSVLLAGAETPPQDAESVFRTRQATCDGFTNLMVALGQRTGDEMIQIVGRSRGTGAELDGFYHAWVAAKIGGAWYLIDPTWNAGAVFGNDFNARYATSYLFTPPAIFAYDHLPNDPAWSFLDPPLTQDAFVAMPALSAHFVALGLRLRGIERATTHVNGQATFAIDNPRKMWVHVLAFPKKADGKTFACSVPTQADPVEVACHFPTPGTWELQLYANEASAGRFQSIGYLQIVSE